MPTIAKSEVIIPKELTVLQREQLADNLYRVHCQIFDGVEKASFCKYVVESKADQTAVQVYQDSAGAIVGYFAVHVFEKTLRGAPTAVFRMEAGMLREYRGNSANARFGIAQLLRCWLAHPRRPIYYLGTLVHPSSYLGWVKHAGQVWPSHTAPLPTDIAAFLAELTTTFALEPVDAHNPLVVHVGWRTRDTEAERAYWRACDKPAARFYVESNPTYGEGHGLMTLVALTPQTLWHGIRRLLDEQVRRTIEPVRMSIQQSPTGRRLFGLGEIRRHLQQTTLFAEVAEADLEQAAEAAEIVTLPAGRYLFRRGDVGDELYVILSGAVYVLAEQRGEEQILDQLASGALFGEIAMLSGEPRTASIRTATKTVLIRLKRRPLLGLMESHPAMRTAIWSAFARRRFLDLTAGGPPQVGALSRQERQAWLAQGQLQRLRPKRKQPLPSHGSSCSQAQSRSSSKIGG
jgi:hypothetical protein